MVLSSNINQYINNSKIRGNLCRWDKSIINVYVAPITDNISDKNLMYSLVEKAYQSWNTIMRKNGIRIFFQKVSEPSEADITVHWVKVGRVYEGMCKYLSVVGNSIKKISLDIGLFNEFSGKNVTELSIYCAIMHEFGHALGLGHGVDAGDVMFVPHQKNVSEPSDNDLFVLKEIYK